MRRAASSSRRRHASRVAEATRSAPTITRRSSPLSRLTTRTRSPCAPSSSATPARRSRRPPRIDVSWPSSPRRTSQGACRSRALSTRPGAAAGAPRRRQPSAAARCRRGPRRAAVTSSTSASVMVSPRRSAAPAPAPRPVPDRDPAAGRRKPDLIADRSRPAARRSGRCRLRSAALDGDPLASAPGWRAAAAAGSRRSRAPRPTAPWSGQRSAAAR